MEPTWKTLEDIATAALKRESSIYFCAGERTLFKARKLDICD